MLFQIQISFIMFGNKHYKFNQILTFFLDSKFNQCSVISSLYFAGFFFIFDILYLMSSTTPQFILFQN